MALRKVTLSVGNTIIGRAITWSYPHDDYKTYEIPTYELRVEGKDDTGLQQNRIFEVIRFGVHRPASDASPVVVGLAKEQTHTIKQWLPNYTVHSAPSVEDGAWQVYNNFLIHDGPDEPQREKYASVGCIELCGKPRGFTQFNDFIITLAGSKRRTRDEQLAEIGSSGVVSIRYATAARPPLKVLASGNP